MIQFLSKWNHLPWHHWNNPLQRYKELPTFVVGEYLIYILTLITFIHARRHGKEHLLVWLASFITGSANDIFFMALPLVDNFWQAQATIMITPRLPLYISCVYVCFLYISTVTVWRLQLPVLAEMAATGVFAHLIYGSYDIIGAKFLWWTWHDTDPPVMNRLFGAPIGSSMWVFTFAGAFTLLIRLFYLKAKLHGLICLILSALITTPLMMVEMAALQAVAREPQGAPDIRSYVILIILYLVILAVQFSSRGTHPNSAFLQPNDNRFNDSILNFGLLIYFASLFVIIILGIPESHRSTGVHQAYGKCGVKVVDFSGLSRHQFVCSKELDEDYVLPPHCSKLIDRSIPMITPRAEPPTQWYTVCGKPYDNYSAYLAVVTAYCFLGHVMYSAVLGHPFRSRIVPFHQSTKKGN